MDFPEDFPESGPYRFENYEDAQAFLLERTVECPKYLVKRGIKREVMCPFTYAVEYNDREEVTIMCCAEYEAPIKGQDGGLGVLAMRDEEDSFSRVAS